MLWFRVIRVWIYTLDSEKHKRLLDFLFYYK